MKKIYTIAVAILVGLTVNAQSGSNNSVSPNATRHQLKSAPQFHRNQSSRSSNGLYLAYDSADSYNTVTVNGLTYQTNQIQDMNMHYKWPADSSSANGDPLQYGVVAFDSLFDPYSFTSYPNASVTDIRIDSLFLVVGQQNLSGIDDTLITQIVTVDSKGYPTSIVKWADTTIISSSASISMQASGMNNWLFGAVLPLAPNYIMTGASRFAVKVKYYGAKVDTFGLQYGFPFFMGNCSGGGPYELALPTVFSAIRTTTLVANSFAFHINRGLGGANGRLFPQESSTGFLYYDCDGTAGYSAAGGDGIDYLQDFSMISFVTTNPLGITENVNNNFSLFQNQPNPFSNQTVVKYQLKKTASNVAVQIYDIRGVKVYENTEKNLKPGNYSLDVKDVNFDSGVYFCTLVVDGERITNKIVKQ